jgi:NTF2 fold immunity protein
METKRHALALTPFLVVLAMGYVQLRQPKTFVPKEGFVPNDATAIAIAEAVLVPVYGKEVVMGERPFQTALSRRDTWIVTGSLHCQGPVGTVCPGGTAEVRISKKSGEILYMIHYQ